MKLCTCCNHKLIQYSRDGELKFICANKECKQYDLKTDWYKEGPPWELTRPKYAETGTD